MNIFEYDNYKEYLNALFDLPQNRGGRRRLAEYLNCQPGFISQVLKADKTNFSLEHLEKVCEFLQLKREEKKYLLTLGQLQRAGTSSLEKFYIDEINHQLEANLMISKKVENSGNKLSEKLKAIYYSHWSYTTIHMLVSIPKYNNSEKISDELRLDLDFTNHVLEFLESAGLIEIINEKYVIGKTRIHIDKDSPHLLSLHQNMRIKAIQSLSNVSGVNLHYSSVLTMSKIDVQKINNLILKLIEDKEKILIPSQNEDYVFLNIDFFT